MLNANHLRMLKVYLFEYLIIYPLGINRDEIEVFEWGMSE
jgi:hypothetical protein